MKLSPLAISIALSVGAALSGFGQGSGQTTPSATAVVIPEGTIIQAELKKGLDASKVQVGDPVNLEVAADVRVMGLVLIPKEARLSARVSYVYFSKAKNARAVIAVEIVGAEWKGGSAELHGRITRVQGRPARVQAQRAREGVQADQAGEVTEPSGPVSQRAPIQLSGGRGEIAGSGGPEHENPGTYDPLGGPLFGSSLGPASVLVLPVVSDGRLMFPSSSHSLPAGTVFWFEHRVPGEGSKTSAPSFASYRDAALRGEAEAQFQFGLMYYEGRHLTQSYVQAAKWYNRAAEQGHARAQAGLGGMYADALGVPQDYVTSYMWFSLASAADPENSQSALKRLESLMTPAEVTEGQRRAEEWLKQHPASH